MRWLVRLSSALCIVCFGATCVGAQTVQWGGVQDQIPPYITHIDRRHGHDHVYPDRGAIVRNLPQGATVVNYAGISYRFAGGVWYEARGPAYMVVAPPISLIVPTLPAFATNVDSRGKSYLYANDVFYRPRPDLGGYEVVNDPLDSVQEGSPAPAGASRAGTPMPIPVGAPQPNATPETSAAPAPSAPAQTPVKAKITAAVPSTPPAASSSPPPGLSNLTRVAIYPRNGQSAEQQARDRYKCYRFAVAQSGFDPLASGGGASSANVAESGYSRAQAACLEGRGYSVR